MAILRTVATLATATTTTAVAAFAFPSSSSSFSSKSHQPKSQNLSFFSSQSLSLLYSNKSPLVKNFSNPPSALPMDAPTSDHKNTSQVQYNTTLFRFISKIFLSFVPFFVIKVRLFNLELLLMFGFFRGIRGCLSFW